ncbi:prenyltransferase/squalene oxidase repeat-containing protein [Streptomyces sp. AS02]|uniref:prenyltransferase/squalene oxidase repeat-containing protein n=1 Tax=Streptomyces sp. AS02 TaxID=2938946 RepID=UPI0020200223|nr:prenyltransferase/squalene oxidase repeat-containing protein [Streptomyces sp. AS02]MCL8010277.1 hypothetical protein [Streptomyces sp. AS02]
MYVRRSAAALAAVTVIGTAGATPAIAVDHTPSASPSVALPAGLYGAADPTYDGVWRQSLALIAQSRMDVQPAVKAIDWLAGQQCADGAFAAFRADPAKACDAKTMVDTNSTAAAVQGLAAVGGHEMETGKAVTWLKSAQNKDGGWGYTPGGASDANSTSVVIGALNAVGEDPAEVRKGGEDGKSPYDALLKLALPCADGGAFAYQPDKKGKLAANADATAAAVVGTLGTGMLATKAGDKKDVACADASDLTAEQASANGAAYLTKAVEKDGYLKSALAGAEDQPDYGNTADAVVALAARAGTQAAQKPVRWLERNAAQWAAQSGPAAYAQLILAADAAGADPRDFGGTDLVKQLNGQGPAPRTAATATESEKPSQEKEEDDNGVSLWWIIGVGLVAGIGIGFLLSGRNKGKRP